MKTTTKESLVKLSVVTVFIPTPTGGSYKRVSIQVFQKHLSQSMCGVPAGGALPRGKFGATGVPP
ncbi:MAG: hypothetical protein O7D30_12630 [Rickettsia endosymbiont of Ixodes persulcatus]|nr:hypothetical protein [Rickettsia endosymbiont of Ixodes persulcatus]